MQRALVRPKRTVRTEPTPPETCELLVEELRGGWLNVPRAYTAFDWFGVGLGGFMAYLGTRQPGPLGHVAVALGAVMVWIHAQRFLYAPASHAGFAQLARAIGMNQSDLDRIRGELPPAP